MKTIIVIQARMNSTRLPGKVLFDLEGKTILEHIVERCEAAGVGQVVVATTKEFADIPICNLCVKIRTPFFCGSENDVLDRFVRCASKHNADHIVRITADCAMIDPKIIKATVDYYFKLLKEDLPRRVDYCASRMIPHAYPDGMDVEIFSFRVLKEAAKSAGLQYDREHVTTWIKVNQEMIRVNLPWNHHYDERIRFSIDTREDYERAKKIYKELYPKNPLFGLEEILEVYNADHS